MCTYKYENDFSVYQKLTEYYKSIILPFLKIVKWEDNILSVFTTKKKKGEVWTQGNFWSVYNLTYGDGFKSGSICSNSSNCILLLGTIIIPQ